MNVEKERKKKCARRPVGVEGYGFMGFVCLVSFAKQMQSSAWTRKCLAEMGLWLPTDNVS